MKITHQLTIHARCPVAETIDYYDALIETDRLIKVEDILTAARRLSAETLYQEDLTQRLAAAIECRVTTTGLHSGVKTICTV